MKERYEYKIDDESKLCINLAGSKFSVVYLFLTDRWIDLARIDNHPHEGKEGTHIHRFGEKRVEFKELDIYESIEAVTNIGDRIKERFKNGLYRNC